VPPIFQSTVFEHRGEPGSYHDVVYPRLNNLPNHHAVGGKIAALEGAERAIPTASGMAAITTTLLSVLGDSGHLLIQEQLYGGTHMFVTAHLGRYGISYDFIDPADPGSWGRKLRPATRAIYVETIANPLTRVVDPRAVVSFAKERGILAIVDATFTSPALFRPIECGFDISLHSATKYLNGHSDVIAGSIAGSKRTLAPISVLLDELGGTLDPHACFLLHRGMKTLALRMERHCANGLALARALEAHPAVARVHYPGLESHPDHAIAAREFSGFGGMLSFELRGGAEAARRVLDRLELPAVGPSLGGVESLATRPATTSHAGLTPAERAKLGISDGLIRVSVGIEAAEDLIADFRQALG
jgi:cystathionine beta-lyase/cystathionine gamma-synthase